MNDRYGASLYEIEIGIVVPAVIYAPVWLAEQRGFLRDEGLTVRLRSFGTTEGTTAALREGTVPVTIGSPEGSILNALGGGDLRLVSQFVESPASLNDCTASLSLDARSSRREIGNDFSQRGHLPILWKR